MNRNTVCHQVTLWDILQACSYRTKEEKGKSNKVACYGEFVREDFHLPAQQSNTADVRTYIGYTDPSIACTVSLKQNTRSRNSLESRLPYSDRHAYTVAQDEAVH